MKTLTKLSFVLTIVGLCLGFSKNGFSQGTGNHITMTQENCILLSPNVLQFDLYITSDGASTSDLRPNALSWGINFNTGIVPSGATITPTNVSINSNTDPIFPSKPYSFPVSTFPDHIKLTQSPCTSCNYGARGTCSVSGTTVTWTSGETFVGSNASLRFNGNDPWDNQIILINGLPFTVASPAGVVDDTHLTLTTSPGTLSGATFSIFTMNVGQKYHAGRIKLTCNQNYLSNTPNYSLQDAVVSGKVSTVGVFYIGSAGATTSFNVTGTGDGDRNIAACTSCVVASASSTPVSCYGATDGTASVTASAGPTPYTYVWSDGETNSSIGPVVAGTYCVTVTDAAACSATACTIITQPLQPTFSCYITNETIDVTHKIYTFDVYLLNTSTSRFEYAAGQFGITVNSAVANSGTLTPSIVAGSSTLSVAGQVPTSVSLPSTFIFNVAGKAPPGAGSGALISSTTTGCTSPGTRIATFRITNSVAFACTTMNHAFNFVGAAGKTQTKIFAYLCGSPSDPNGPFTAGVNTDITALGKFFRYDTAATCLQNINLGACGGCSLTASATSTPVNCSGGNNGTATASAGSVIGPLTYLWSNGQTNSTATALTAGIYSVTITDNGATNCTATATTSVTQPSALSASSSSGSIACNGGSATVTVTASGGTAPYNGTGNFSRSAGTYTFIVTDAHSCTASTVITITQPTVLSASSSSGSIACNGGSTTVTVTASGGTAPYNGTGNFSRSAGNYTFIVTDANSCTASTVITVTQPSALSASSSSGSIACNGGSATVTITGSGGTAPYNGTGNFSRSAGNYTFIVTDANSCTASTVITITQPSAITASSSSGSIACNGGSTTVTVTASGGTAPYSGTGNFSRTAGSYTFIVTDANNCTATTIITVTQPTALTANSSSAGIACNGGSATVTVTASGGTAPYNGTGNFSRTAGSYTFIVTDANNCTASTSITLTQPSAVSANCGSTNGTCATGGSASVTASGGTGPYTYLWSNTATASSISGLAAGPYSVTVKDANNCTGTCSVNISQAGAPTATCGGTPVTCNGGNNGSASVTATGGTPGYTYLWSNGATNSSISGLSAASYSVTITDANTCKASCSFNVTQPTAVTASSSSGSIACNGGSTTVTVTASGGTAPYNGTGSFSRSAGTYTFIVTDANSCTASTVIAVTQPTTVTASSSSGSIACNGGSTTVTVTASGGTAPYNGTGSFSRSAGSYTFIVTDANSCTASTIITITQPSALSASSSSGSIACNGGSTTVTVTASGGTAPYNGTGNFSRSAGSYTFIVTDANSCTASAVITITQPTALSASSSAGGIACNGGSATVTVTASGGTAPYNGTGTFTRSAGSYTFIVTDANSCTASTVITVTQPSAITASSSSGNIACNGGSTTVTVTASGGTPPYSGTGNSSRSAGTYTFIVTDANSCTTTTIIAVTQPTALTANSSSAGIACNGGSATVTLTASGGTAPYSGTGNFSRTVGSYTFIVTDANSCTASTSITLTQPSAVSANCGSTNGTCATGGSASVTASGGTGPYTYLWSNSATASSISGLAAGPYSVTVKDANNCTGTCSVNISQVGAPNATCGGTSVSCNGGSNGSACITASGGTPGYTYIWSNGETSSCISNLSAANYSVTITDANSCKASCSFNVTQPTAVTASSSSGNIACNGGSTTVTVTASGGTPPYSGTGSASRSAGTYTFVVTDANNCTGSTVITVTEPSILSAASSSGSIACNGGSATVTVTGSGGTAPYNGTGNFSRLAGIYTFIVTDANNCTASTSITLTEPSAVSASCGSTNGTCATGGTASVTASGGTGPYTYLWSNTATASSISGLAAGPYSVTVKDANNCTGTCSVNISQTGGPTATCGGTPVSAGGGSDGSASVTASGGNPGYTYLWNTGAATSSISGLTAGNYCVTVTDNSSCNTSCCFNVTEPSSVNASCGGTPVSCNGGSNGSASITASSGTPSYTYLWNNGASTSVISNLTAGTYSVTVTDAQNGTGTCSFDVTQPTAISASSSSGNIACNGGSATVTVTASGGTAPYNGTGNFSRTAGSYTFIVTDANNCTASTSITLTQPSAVSANCGSTNGTCATGGSASVTASGGTGPYTYLWSNSATSSSISGLAAGPYSVTVKDANNCTGTCSVNISQAGAPTATCGGTPVTCNGGSNGSASVTATGGTPGYTYLWSNGATNSSISGLSAATYSVTITDANTCKASCSFNVTQPTAVTASSSSGSIACNGGSTTVTVTASGGTTPYNGTGSFSRSAGSYTFIVTDANNCTASTVITITQPSALSASSSSGSIACNGGSTTVTVTASGGTSPYNGTGSFSRSAGTYTFIVTDANNCTASTAITLTQPSAVSANCGSTNGTCATGGSASVTASGGTGPYTYLWSNSASASSISGLAAGPYSVTVKDANNCTGICSVNISQAGAPTATCGGTSVSCNGGSNGSACVTASGGTPGYTYSWSNGATSSCISNLSAANYSVTITDANSCKASCSFNVTQPTAVTASSSSGSIACNGGSTTVTVTASGGAAPYIGTGNFSRTAGSYTFIVTDNRGCTASTAITITQPSALTASSGAGTIACNGGNTTVNVSASGGTAPYSGTGNFSRAVGAYTFIVTDANGCTAITTGTITQPSALSVACGGTNGSCSSAGSVSVTASGGTPAYAYLWNNGATISSVSGLSAGTYSVTVTDARGCKNFCSSTITQSSTLVATCGGTNVSCNGSNNGSASVTAIGGTNISYLWNNTATTSSIGSLSAGNYSVTVSDLSGCTGSCSFTVTQPSVLTCFIAPPSNPPACGSTGNALTAQATGGNGGYTYSWSVTGSGWAITGSITANPVTYTAGSSGSGTFTVIIIDSKGCRTSCSLLIGCSGTAGNQGCGIGFWKNHQSLWDHTNDAVSACVAGAISSAGYSGNGTINSFFDSTFGLTANQMSLAGLPANLTLLGALQLQGGQMMALAREAVAALLSSCYVNYPYTSAYVISSVHSSMIALTFQPLLSQLGTADDATCPSSKTVRIENTNDTGNLFALVYPNPASEKATVRFIGPVDAQYHLELLDLIGRQLMIKEGKVVEGTNSIELDTRSLSKGVYLLNLRAGEQSQQIKLIIQ